MFYYISGTVAAIEANLAVIDCGGVGYACSTTNYTLSQLSKGANAKLFTYLHIKEDAVDLFGFASQSELNSFKMLIGVSGVGPKAALSILSSATPQNLAMAVVMGDEKALTAAPGVGKKLAQRIILELKDKIGGGSMELDFSGGPAVAAAPVAGNNTAMANAALQELGYSPAQIATALKGVDPGATTEEMIRYALRAMVMRN